MNGLTEIIYKIKLNRVNKNLTKNTEKIGNYCIKEGLDNINQDEFQDNFGYNHLRLEHLRLMSCRSYLENKLSHSGN